MTCARAPKPSARPAAALTAALLLATAASSTALTPDERQTVIGMRSAITSLRGKLDATEAANRNYLQAVQKATAQAAALQDSARAAASDAARLAAERDDLAAQAAATALRIERLDRRYQTAQMIIAGAVATLALVLALQLGAGLPPQYRIAVSAGAAMAAAGAVYVVL